MFDLIILGGGPGGYHLAHEAGKANMKIAIIEEKRLGGTCLNVGCIPSKAFLHIEKVVIDANEAHEIGVVGEKLVIDQKKVIKYKDSKVDMLVAGIEAKMKNAKAQVYYERGIILKSKTTGEFRIQVGKEIIVGTKLVIATGSVPIMPPIKGVEKLIKNDVVISSTGALALTEIPKDLTVIGGGIIGLELGSYYATAGSNVTVLNRSGRIAKAIDQEIGQMFHKVLETKGIKFILNATLQEITDKIVIYQDQDGKTQKLKHSKVLMAVGRKPNLNNIGLENINVEFTVKGIMVDEKLQTTTSGVYAIGDVTGKSMLAHTASKHAEIVIDNLLGGDVTMDYTKVPSVIYGVPEVAEIGITEDKAKAEGIKVKVKKLSMLYSGRFIIEDASYNGLLKVVIKEETQEIIGMSIFGNYASEIIHAATILVGKRFAPSQVRSLIFAHPTVGEIIKDVIFS